MSAMDLDDDRFERARRRGYGGGLIPEHRAFVTLPRSAAGLAAGTLMVVMFTAGWALALQPLGRGYVALYSRVVPLLDPGARVAAATLHPFGPVRFPLPYVEAVATPPTPAQWLVLAGLTALGLVASLLLPPSLLPLAYALRIGAALQAASLAYFHFAGDRFPYTLSGYALDQMAASLGAVAVAPALLGLTYYVFQFSWPRKAALTAALMAHVAVLVPLQGLVVVGLLRAGSLALMPALFTFFGVLPLVMVFVALYGWGMSWPSRLDADA